MKIKALLCLSILCHVFVYAQTKTPALILSSDNSIRINIREDKGALLNKPLTGIEVLDMRDDTSSIGYNYSAFYKKFRAYIFEKPVSGEISNWIKDYLGINEQQHAGYKLLICVKKLRISEQVAVAGSDNGQQNYTMDEWESGVVIKTEFYLNDGFFYYPMYRFDSAISMNSKLPDHANEYLAEAFTAALKKLYAIDFDQVITKGKKMEMLTIVQNHRNYANYPVLASTAYKKGAYANFEEF